MVESTADKNTGKLTKDCLTQIMAFYPINELMILWRRLNKAIWKRIKDYPIFVTESCINSLKAGVTFNVLKLIKYLEREAPSQYAEQIKEVFENF